MLVTITEIKGEKDKSIKYGTTAGVLNAVKSKVPRLELNKSYDVTVEESDYTKPDGGVTKMKWITKVEGAASGSSSGSTTAVGAEPKGNPAPAMTKEDWQHKDAMARRTMVLSYAKDILCAQLASGKLLTVSDMLSWYSEMLEIVEKP